MKSSEPPSSTQYLELVMQASKVAAQIRRSYPELELTDLIRTYLNLLEEPDERLNKGLLRRALDGNTGTHS